ncbi:MAG: tetratricopeptide repeat protein [Candidatus Promineifilaceae bacterium]
MDSRTGFEEALRRGHAYTWDQRWPEAINEFRSAIAELPSEPAPYAGLAAAFFELEELDKALECYKLAARYSKGDAIYLRHVADLQERLGQLTDAGQTYMALAEIQLRRNQNDEAVTNWLRAVRVEPGLVGGHQRLAHVYQREGLTQNAIREYLALARIYNQRGERERALSMCQAALSLDPRNPNILTAIELVQQGEAFELDDDEAVRPAGVDASAAAAQTAQRIVSALELDFMPEEVNQGAAGGPAEEARQVALAFLARQIFEDEDDEAAANGRSMLSKLEQDSLISQGLDYQGRQMLDEAISCFERAVAGGLAGPAARFNLGMLYQERSRFSQAQREFRQTQSEPDYRLGSLFALGQVSRTRGQLDEALSQFLTALELIDLETVGPERQARLRELYRPLAAELASGRDGDGKAAEFISGLIDFLSAPNWRERAMGARARLDRLSSDGRMLILGDMLTAGSAHVLESLYLSQEYASQGNFSSAIEEAFRAIQLSPFYLPGHLQIAALFARQERLDVAVEKYITIGDTFAIRGDINGAVGCYERALELEPMNLAARGKLIELLVEHSRIDRALEHYVTLADGYYKQAEIERAREVYLEGLRLAPRGSDKGAWRLKLLAKIADIDMQRLDWKRALAAYSELGAAEPGNERIAQTIIDIYFKLDQPGRALQHLDQFLIQLVRGGQTGRVTEVLEELVAQRPNHAGLVDRLTRLYTRQKRKPEAIALLDRLAQQQLAAGETDKAIATLEQLISLGPADAARFRQMLERARQQPG